MRSSMFSSLAGTTVPVSRPGVRILAWSGALLASFLVAGFAAATPWVSEGTAVLIKAAYQTLCHQRLDRSFSVGGIAFAVCHRCFGIYAGIVAGLAAARPAIRFRFVLRRNVQIVLSVVLAPLLLDWGLDTAGVLSNTPLTRFGTGLLLGVLGGIYLSLAIWTGGRPAHSSNSQKE